MSHFAVCTPKFQGIVDEVEMRITFLVACFRGSLAQKVYAPARTAQQNP